MKCLVSGATGFVGSLLCQQLSAQKIAVTALSRYGAALPDGSPTLAQDLAGGDPDVHLLANVDVVFHLAGIAHRRAAESDYQQLNYLATLRLARLAADNGVRCFVFLSSVKAMGPASGAVERAEQDCTPPLDAYGKSKWQAECALREEFADSEMAVVILRPALVYGPNARGNLALLARGVRYGMPRPPQRGGRSMIALEDLVSLLVGFALNPPAGLHTWIACDGQRYSTRYLYDSLRTAAGRGRALAWLPGWGWRAVSALLDLRRGPGDEPFYQKLFGTELYDNTAVVEARNWQPTDQLQHAAEALMSASGSAPQ